MKYRRIAIQKSGYKSYEIRNFTSNSLLNMYGKDNEESALRLINN